MKSPLGAARMSSPMSGRLRGDDPDLASYLWIEERELEAGSGN